MLQHHAAVSRALDNFARAPPPAALASPPAAAPAALSVTVTAARFVATWRWNVADADDVCGICRLAFEAACPACKLPGDECPPLLGGCKHAFHLHCIVAWLNTKDKEQVCPLCRRPWDTST